MTRKEKRDIEAWREKNRVACALLQVETEKLRVLVAEKDKRIAELEAMLVKPVPKK